jgi:hypothetical protein
MSRTLQTSIFCRGTPTHAQHDDFVIIIIIIINTPLSCQEASCVCRQAACESCQILPLVGLASSKHDNTKWTFQVERRTLVDLAVAAAAQRRSQLESSHEHGRSRAQDVRQARHVRDGVGVGRVGRARPRRRRRHKICAAVTTSGPPMSGLCRVRVIEG